MTFVLGYGNPGREDDGLGPAAALAIEKMAWPDVAVSHNYQLVIEDSIDIAKSNVVWFIDSSKVGLEPFEISSVLPAHTMEFSSHILQPGALLALTQLYFGRSPKAYLLGIRGYSFEFREGLTPRAAENLRLAVAALTGTIYQSQEVCL